MTWDEMIATIPPEDYQAACAEARWSAALADYGRVPEAVLDSQIPHDLAWLIWDSDLPESERLRLASVAYAEMPCYAHAMYFHLNFSSFSDEGRLAFWAWVRSILAGEDDGAWRPLTYGLHVDFCEYDPDAAGEVWSRLIDARSNRRILLRLLDDRSGTSDVGRPTLYARARDFLEMYEIPDLKGRLAELRRFLKEWPDGI